MSSRSVLVTGGSRGIGLAICERFLDAGDLVVNLDVDVEPSDDAQDSLFRQVEGSVGRRSDVERAVDICRRASGRLDIAVCNAGVVRYMPFLELDDETWAAHLNVDLTGAFITAQTAARAMVQTGGGVIIIVTSISAERPSSTQGHYCAAKAGAQMLADAMAWELGPQGVRVNAVAPGWVETRLTEDYLADPQLKRNVESTVPLGRVGQPADIAKAVYYLASEDASYVTGAHLRVDGGLIIGKDKT